MRKGRASGGLVALVATLWTACGLALGIAAAQSPAGEPVAQGAGGKRSPEARSEPELRLGELARPSGRVATVPVYLMAGQGKPLGSISGELLVPKGSWTFQMAEPPKGSWWKVGSKDKGEERSKDSTKAPGMAVVELTFTAAGRLLQDGLLGYLSFQVEPPGSAAPAGLGVRKIGSSGAASGPAKAGAKNPSPTAPAEAPSFPVQGCFFFSH